MLVYLLLIAGIYAVFAKKVAVTKNTEISRPQTYYFALSVLAGVIIFLRGASSEGDVKILLALIGFLIPIISALYLKKPKAASPVHSVSSPEQK